MDPDLPYVVRRAPGTDGVPRDVFVFRLQPVGPVAAGETLTSAPSRCQPGSLCLHGRRRRRTGRSGQLRAIRGSEDCQRPGHPKRHSSPRGSRGISRPTSAKYAIPNIPVGSTALYSDLADVTANVVYEAKGSGERMSVRLALGQVLDYGRYVDQSKLAVLLPESACRRPS